MKTLLILDRPESISKIKQTRKSLIITLNPDIQRKLQKMGLKYKTDKDYLNKKAYEKIGREAILLVREWGNLKVNGKPLREFLTYKDLPFWDLIESNFAVRLFESSKKLHNIKLMKKIIQTEKPDKIVVEDKTIPGRSAICVAKRFGIEVEKINPGTVENLKYYCDTQLQNYFFRYANKLKELERLFFTEKIKKWFRGNKKKILIIPMIETHTSIITPVIRKLKKNGNYELLTLGTGSLRERMKKSLGRAGIKSIPIEAFITKNVKKRTDDVIKFLKERWKILKSSKGFKSSLKCMEIPIWDLVREDFEFYFSTRARIIEVVKYTETMREILDKERPDIIVSLDELSELGKPMALLARKRKIPLLIIQHGLFGKGSFIFGPSLATKKCVWGPYVKKLLLKRWFTKEQLVVTGCPKFDALKEKRKDKEIYRELGLEKGKPIITFLSQPVKEVENAAIAVLKTMKMFPDKQLVVKLHPREFSEKFYKQTAKRIGVKIKITRDSDLYDTVRISDGVIGLWSTACLEVLILNKPLITVNLTNIPYTFPYVERGGAIGVYKEENMKKAILSFEKQKEELERRRKGFIYEYAYKMDGKATERIIELINLLL
jgi:UDP-N-acetylglucosamine:LPS N-acetylglucosamine transferase